MPTENLTPAAAPAIDSATGSPDGRDPFDLSKLDAIAALTEEQISTMSEKDIEMALGAPQYDRSTEARPAGDAPYHDMVRAAAEAASATPAATPAVPAVAAAAPTPPVAAAVPVVAAAAKDPAVPAPAAAGVVDEDLHVATRDGKGRIDYQVLAEARKENSRLKRELENARAANTAAATPAIEVQEPAEPAHETIEIGEEEIKLLSATEIDALKKDYPESIVNMLIANNKIAVASYVETTNLRNQLHEQAVARREMSVQDWIDGHPVASIWFNTNDAANSALAEEAMQTDEMLKAIPLWAAKPSTVRMEEAVRRTALANGVATPAADPAVPTPTLQERARAAVAAAAQHPQVPVTHSDLPAGGAPAQTEREVVAGLSTTQLESKFEKMSPADIERYLIAAV